MPTILPVLLALSPVLSKTTCRQLHHIVVAMLAMTGRITQLGISRWTDKGGSYRTVQRFFHALSAILTVLICSLAMKRSSPSPANILSDWIASSLRYVTERFQD